jgi:DNA polymerase delta subunit 3
MPDASESEKSPAEAPPEPEKKAEPKEGVSVTEGRRRGRRQIMKKKRIKDEEGYLGKY